MQPQQQQQQMQQQQQPMQPMQPMQIQQQQQRQQQRQQQPGNRKPPGPENIVGDMKKYGLWEYTTDTTGKNSHLNLCNVFLMKKSRGTLFKVDTDVLPRCIGYFSIACPFYGSISKNIIAAFS